jgi:hypothetical protein
MRQIRLAALAVVVAAQVLQGEVLTVPQEYPTIQSAINAAQRSDTVLVSEGRYYENIDFKGKGIVVASLFIRTKDAQTIANTIIDGSRAADKDSASTVRFLNREDSTAVLEGFTVTGGTGTRYTFDTGNTAQEGAGIIISHGKAVVRNNLICGNVTRPKSAFTTISGGGGGISTMYGNPTVCNNVIASNQAGYAAGMVMNWSGGKVRNNLIYHNIGGVSWGGGGLMVWRVPDNSAIVENNTIVGNVSLKDAGGISMSILSGAIPVIRNNIIWGNAQASGGQVSFPQYLTYNDIEDYSGGTNFSADPKLAAGIFTLGDGSPCIDAGDPSAVFNDPEDPAVPGSAKTPSKGLLRNDVGAFGGPSAAMLQKIEVSDIYVGPNTVSLIAFSLKRGKTKIELSNPGTDPLTIDSLTLANKAVFSLSGNVRKNALGMFGRDSVLIEYLPPAGGVYYDTLKVFHQASGSASPVKVPVRLSVTAADVETEPSAPQGFRLYPNAPNPFNPSTRIRFSMPSRAHVSLTVFDCRGRVVGRLVDGPLEAGEHGFEWNPGTGLCGGVYIAAFKAEQFFETEKIVYQK